MVPSRTPARLVIVTLLAGAVLAALPTASADDACSETTTGQTACAGLDSRWSYLLLPKPAGCDEVAGQCLPEGVSWGPEHVDFVLLSAHAGVDTGLCQISTFCRVDVDTASVTDDLFP